MDLLFSRMQMTVDSLRSQLAPLLSHETTYQIQRGLSSPQASRQASPCDSPHALPGALPGALSTSDTILQHVADLEANIIALQRALAAERSRTLSERDIANSEMHAELVDREANSARVSERQRFLFERNSSLPGQSTAADRAVGAVHYVEAALVALCPHESASGGGCEQLAQ